MADNPQFLDVLRRFQKISDSERESISAAIEDKSLSWDALKQAISPEIAAFLMMLLIPELYQGNEAFPEELREEVENARQEALLHYGKLTEHPAFARRASSVAEQMNSSAAESNDERGGMRALKQNRGLAIAIDLFWKNTVKGLLSPTLRLAFSGSDDDQSVVTIARPPELLKIADTLLEVTIGEFERSLTMAEKGLLDFPESEENLVMIQKMEGHLSRLREMAGLLADKLEENGPAKD